MRDDNFHFNRRNDIIAVLGQYRVMDKAVQERILNVSYILKLEL